MTERILIVDDQREIVDLTEMVLGDAGFETVGVSSGVDALDHLARQRFDLVLLDINMPEMDGWETLRLLRADHDLDDVPVVMFSVKGELHDKVAGMQEGATDYITKPFVVDQLLERVERILESAHGAAAEDPA